MGDFWVAIEDENTHMRGKKDNDHGYDTKERRDWSAHTLV
jgi:hypothetical protein